MKKNERLQALRILTKLLDQNVSLSASLGQTELSPLTKTICFGVCRYYFRLEAIADYLIKKRPKDTQVWLIILIGLYQLQELRIPPYAVVKETVGLLDTIKKFWAKNLVNAVLRTYCRQANIIHEKLDTKERYRLNHPQWLLERYKKSWPNDWEAMLAANDQHPPLCLRVNHQRQSSKAYLKRLEDQNIQAHLTAFSPDGVELEKPCDVHTLPGFKDGDVSVQDQAAQLAAGLLDLQAGQRVLDACCAPGGKTCHILEKEPNLKTCIAIDIEPQRLKRVHENLNRLHLKAQTLVGDGLKPETWWDGTPFDRILLDAPCSATGVIRRHPDIKLLRTEAEITEITRLQKKLLQALWPLLAPGGLLVYATCSVMPEENELQVAQFVKSHQDCMIFPETKPWGRSTGHGWQILPGTNNMDGFFYSQLFKRKS